MKQYTMSEQLAVTTAGTNIIVTFLKNLAETEGVWNAETHPVFQEMDVDLIWLFRKNEEEFLKLVEIKVDTYTSPNLFYETISNTSKQTPGCFEYTKADYIFYYFLKMDILYILPTQVLRAWVNQHRPSFKEVTVGTVAYNKELYQTKGLLIPRKRVETAIPSVRKISLLGGENHV